MCGNSLVSNDLLGPVEQVKRERYNRERPSSVSPSLSEMSLKGFHTKQDKI